MMEFLQYNNAIYGICQHLFAKKYSKNGIFALDSADRLCNFEKLNEAGQDRLVEFSEMLLSKNEYKAGGESPSSSSGETVRVFMAARSTDNTPPEWVNMPKEEVERIFNAPESDLDI